jgi:AraC-like DNA-binding protein
MMIYIKNMVCDRCKLMVEQVLQQQGLQANRVLLGEIELQETSLSAAQSEQLQKALAGLGFELLEDKRKVLVSRIKAALVELAHYQDEPLRVNLSDFLANKLQQDYSALSLAFSAAENLTIEKYFIQQKIERVKELLSYGELTLSEIAHRLNYSSVAHLSAQFKKETGQNPSQYKQHKARRSLDGI